MSDLVTRPEPDDLPAAPPGARRPWTDAEVIALTAARDDGRDLRCPVDGGRLDVTPRPARAALTSLSLYCPGCGNTRVIGGTG